MYSCDMKTTSTTSIETQVPGRDFSNTENTSGTETAGIVRWTTT